MLDGFVGNTVGDSVVIDSIVVGEYEFSVEATSVVLVPQPLTIMVKTRLAKKILEFIEITLQVQSLSLDRNAKAVQLHSTMQRTHVEK